MMRGALLAALLVAGLLGARPARAEEGAIRCALRADAAGAYAGECDVPCRVVSWAVGVHGPIEGKACDFPARRSPITLRRDGAGWRGTMAGKFTEDPTLVLLTPDVAKLPFGWFRVQELAAQGGSMTLVIDGAHLLPATQDDFAILERARALLTAATWNRHDTRTCPADATQWSLFCSLIKATEAVEGGVHYRQPALQAVREVIDEVGGDRTDKHRLMDYNNNAATTLDDVHRVLDMARDRLRRSFM